MPRLTAARKRTTLELVANFLDNMEDALNSIDSELAHTANTVYPSQTSLAASSWTDEKGKVHTVGSGGGSRGPSASPVERQVIDARQRLRDAEWNLWEQFNSIVQTAHAGSREATAANKRRIPHHDLARCNRGTSHKWQRDEGFVEWQDPDCERFPGDNPLIEGMCDHCLTLCNDWRIAHGLGPITRDEGNYRHTVRGERGRFTAA